MSITHFILCQSEGFLKVLIHSISCSSRFKQDSFSLNAHLFFFSFSFCTFLFCFLCSCSCSSLSFFSLTSLTSFSFLMFTTTFPKSKTNETCLFWGENDHVVGKLIYKKQQYSYLSSLSLFSLSSLSLCSLISLSLWCTSLISSS